ncbi:hypothetical protein LguiA_020370 [Lonicera macranthoides]
MPKVKLFFDFHLAELFSTALLLHLATPLLQTSSSSEVSLKLLSRSQQLSSLLFCTNSSHVPVVGARGARGLTLTIGSEVFEESGRSLLRRTIDYLHGLKMDGVIKIDHVLPTRTMLTIVVPQGVWANFRAPRLIPVRGTVASRWSLDVFAAVGIRLGDLRVELNVDPKGVIGNCVRVLDAAAERPRWDSECSSGNAESGSDSIEAYSDARI